MEEVVEIEVHESTPKQDKQTFIDMMSKVKQEQTGNPNARYLYKNNIKCIPKPHGNK